MQIVLNTTLCGTWAGDKFANGGRAACENYVKTADLSDAYWSVDYIKVFVRSDVYPGALTEEPFPWRNSSVPLAPKNCVTVKGDDMWRTGKCCPCTAALTPYLIVPNGRTEGKYYCYASAADAAAVGEVKTPAGAQPFCEGFSARRHVHESMKDFTGVL